MRKSSKVDREALSTLLQAEILAGLQMAQRVEMDGGVPGSQRIHNIAAESLEAIAERAIDVVTECLGLADDLMPRGLAKSPPAQAAPPDKSASLMPGEEVTRVLAQAQVPDLNEESEGEQRKVPLVGEGTDPD